MYVQVFKDWLTKIIDQLYSKRVELPDENGRRMASVLSLICSLHFLQGVPSVFDINKFSTKSIESLLSMLLLNPYVDDQKCTDLDIVLTMVSRPLLRKVSDALIFICNHISFKKQLSSPQWLYAIPLVHVFVEKDLIPFGDLEIELEKIRWSDGHFTLAHIQCPNRQKNLK